MFAVETAEVVTLLALAGLILEVIVLAQTLRRKRSGPPMNHPASRLPPTRTEAAGRRV
jgi:hypothetical protein